MPESQQSRDEARGQLPVPPKDATAQLQRILSHPIFRKGERISRFLAFIVDQTLAGRSHTIKQGTIAREAYDRKTGFDAHTDPIIRVEARRLRRLLDEYYRTAGAADPIRISVPKGRYVPIFEPRESVATVDPVVSEHGGPSVAVVQFENLTSSPSNDFVPIGLTDELIARLTCFSDLVVIGPLHRDDTGGDRAHTARQVGASFSLHGSIRHYAERVQVSVSLIEVRGGATLWAENFGRELSIENLFSIREEIVNAIAGAVADDYGVISRTLAAASAAQTPTDLTAYEAVLKARAWQNKLDNDSLMAARDALEHAVEIAPSYALAKAFLSDVYAIDHHLNLGLTGHSQPLDRAEELAREAVELDRYCQTSAWCLGAVHFHRRRRRLCIAELERAISLNPMHPMAIAACGLFFTMLGEHERGTELIATAQRLNPYHPSWYHLCLFIPLYCRGDYDEALAESLQFQSPDYFWPPLIRAAVLGQMGQEAEAEPELRELLRRFPDFHRSGADVMRLTVYTEDHVQALLDGLEKAGIEKLR